MTEPGTRGPADEPVDATPGAGGPPRRRPSPSRARARRDETSAPRASWRRARGAPEGPARARPGLPLPRSPHPARHLRAAPRGRRLRVRRDLDQRHPGPLDRDRGLLRALPPDGPGARGLRVGSASRRHLRRVPRRAGRDRLGQGQAERHPTADPGAHRPLPAADPAPRPRRAAQHDGHLPEVPLAGSPGVVEPRHADLVQRGRDQHAGVRRPDDPPRLRRRLRRQPRRPLARPAQRRVPDARRERGEDRLRRRDDARRDGRGVHRPGQDQDRGGRPARDRRDQGRREAAHDGLHPVPQPRGPPDPEPAPRPGQRPHERSDRPGAPLHQARGDADPVERLPGRGDRLRRGRQARRLLRARVPGRRRDDRRPRSTRRSRRSSSCTS